MRTSVRFAATGSNSKQGTSASFWALLTLIALVAVAWSTPAQAQNFVYVTNRTATTNTVSGFAVDAGGVLTAVPGSPFSTGGTGASVLCCGYLSNRSNL